MAQTSDAEPEVNQPGLAELREAVANRLPDLPSGRSLRKDAIAGLNSAVSSVPDGMASGVLVGVNPVYGLYACMLGPIVGGVFSSTRLMIVATTSAASLSAGQALGRASGDARLAALLLMVVSVGLLQILFGVLGAGRVTRFVSYSVMTGFIMGIAVLTILSQLPVISGYEPEEGDNKVTQTFNLLSNLDRVNVWSLATAALALVLAILLPRTKLGNFGRLVAIILPSALAAVFGLETVQVVRDVGEIPSGIPTLHLPSFSDFSFDVLTGALAVAIVILVQGAGVSQSVPNPDGSRRSMSRDFVAQGAANVASGLIRGLPVGGSLSTTALTVISGARTHWAAIFAGLWMALLVMVFPGAVSYVVMPALGMLLIVASLFTIKPSEALAVWNAGWSSRLAAAITFFSTLLLPIQAAVGIGVALSALLYVNHASTDVSVVALVRRDDGKIEERKPPRKLPSGQVTVLDIYGHLFYAGARTLGRLLPAPGDAQRPFVVLRMRGREMFGATLLEVLSNYAEKLREVEGHLYLTGLSEQAYQDVVGSGKLTLSGPVDAYQATSVVYESTGQAVADAQVWLAGKGESDG
ncbi:MAG TPA: SulP family inorganic anion transporter [Thermoanaerobaculia bacterium]|nr:SulP family inorganic anion transporter [Thermoanaerobaculia bacterium]